MAEKLNGPGFGARMALAGQGPSFEGLKAALAEVAAKSAEAQDALRELLSYCENESADSHILSGDLAYADVAARLRDILDGE